MSQKNCFRVVAGLLLFLMVFAVYCAWPRPTAAVLGNDESVFTLIIDPGHGGEDGGAVSVSGKKESDLNLSISRKAGDLSALLGISCKLIREADISVYSGDGGSIAQKKVSDLKNRVKIVNLTPNALLLSIHQNHFSDGKYSGAQVFHAKTSGSEALARMIQTDIKTFLDPANNRQCKVAEKVYLMENVHCPAVLVECGFLSNFREDHLLQQENYQKKLAMTMLRGIAVMGRNTENNEI